MALRRLMSGWLIALAAMARATASALERAAAEQSAPAVDPVMADLVERYPDAPAHWLAFMAERMSQAADAVEMSSSPAESAAEGVSAPESLLAITPGSMFTDAPPPSASPIAPGFRSARRREEVTVPSLAELASRPSEVWRRPGARPSRPSRPVFARPVEAMAPIAAAMSRKDAPSTVRRARPPLTVDPRAASRIWPDRPPLDDASFDMRPSDVSQPLAAPTSNGELSAELAAAASISRPPTLTPTLTKRPAQNARSNDPPSTMGETAEEEPLGTRLVPAASKTDPETAPRGPFFDPTSSSPLPPEPSSREPTSRAARPPPRDPTVSEVEALHSQRSPARPLAAVRSTARRVIVQAVAALRPRVAFASHRASHRQAPAGAPPSIASPTIVLRPQRSTSPSAPTSATTGESSTAPMEIRAPRAEGRETSVEAAPWSPHRRMAHGGGDTMRDEPSSARRPELRASEFAPAFAQEPAPRPSLAVRRASPTHGRTHAASSPSDDRWPSLPPSARPPTPEVEAPAPRLRRLARDQEEGLWSA
jgi:hypothetical protein